MLSILLLFINKDRKFNNIMDFLIRTKKVEEDEYNSLLIELNKLISELNSSLDSNHINILFQKILGLNANVSRCYILSLMFWILRNNQIIQNLIQNAELQEALNRELDQILKSNQQLNEKINLFEKVFTTYDDFTTDENKINQSIKNFINNKSFFGFITKSKVERITQSILHKYTSIGFQLKEIDNKDNLNQDLAKKNIEQEKTIKATSKIIDYIKEKTNYDDDINDSDDIEKLSKHLEVFFESKLNSQSINDFTTKNTIKEHDKKISEDLSSFADKFK